MILRDYQNNLVSKAEKALSEYGNTLAVAATGAGKTIMLAELAKRIGGKTLVLQHRDELIYQNESKFRLVNKDSKSFNGLNATSFVKANDKDYSGQAVFAMVQTISRNGNINQMPRFDHLIIDECVSGDTLISGIPIREIKEGYIVDSYNHNKKIIEKKRVVRVFKKKASKILTIKLSNGCLIQCTENHKFFVDCEYLPASQISVNMFLTFNDAIHQKNNNINGEKNNVQSLLCSMWNICRGKETQSRLPLSLRNVQEGKIGEKKKNIKNQLLYMWQVNGMFWEVSRRAFYSLIRCWQQGSSLLFRCLQFSKKRKGICRCKQKNGQIQQNLCVGTNEKIKPDAQRINKTEDDNNQKSEWDVKCSPCYTKGKWNGTNSTSIIDGCFSWLGNGSSCKYSYIKRKIHRFTSLLQDRCCKRKTQDSNRDRWGGSCRTEKTFRQEEGCCLERVRVESIEIQEQRNIPESSRLYQESFVYDLEIEDNHNYFANGILVHNCHHATSESYVRIIERIRDLNPNALLSGFTATPCRVDGKGLRRAGFDNCCAEISTEHLIGLGFLVPPVCYVLDLDGVDFKSVHKTAGEYDMDEVAEIMDVEVHNETVFQKWFEKAGSKEAGQRKTIIFCSTVKHAENVCIAFRNHGINAVTISGDTPTRQREEQLKDFSTKSVESGGIQVVCNCAVLTEGYDNPSCSCVILLRPCSAKSTMIQMIGRGLRINPEGRKDDCIVLDFGMSLTTHGDLVSSGKRGIDDKTKKCPSCESQVPFDTEECPICGFVWEQEEPKEQNPFWFCPVALDKNIIPELRKCKNINPISKDEPTCPYCGAGKQGFDDDKETLNNVNMILFNIINQSPFKWADIFNTNSLLVASGFESSAYVVSKDGGNSFFALGKTGKKHLKVLQAGNKAICLSAADDFLRMNESSDAASKSKRWLLDYPTEKQISKLNEFGYQLGGYGLGNNQLTKYDANCHLSFQWHRKQIEKAIGL